MDVFVMQPGALPSHQLLNTLSPPLPLISNSTRVTAELKLLWRTLRLAECPQNFNWKKPLDRCPQYLGSVIAEQHDGPGRQLTTLVSSSANQLVPSRATEPCDWSMVGGDPTKRAPCGAMFYSVTKIRPWSMVSLDFLLSDLHLRHTV